MSKAAVSPSPSDPVDALIKSIRIPPRPSLLADLQRELAAPDPAPGAIARIVASDVGMSGALLKLANSPFYGSARRAKSVEHATTPALANFWDISTRRAQAMAYLARRLRLGAPDVAHTFGLFCDTGVPLLMERFADYGATFAEAASDAVRPLTALEQDRHSTSHAAIGCLLAHNWGLSAEVAWAILHHHDYPVLEDAATHDAVRSLVALSLLAERAIAKYQGHAGSLEWDKGGARACAFLGLPEEETLELLDELHDAFHDQD
jgi:HD-like signal output (HDOD) protein